MSYYIDSDGHHEESAIFVGCTCDHDQDDHTWGECMIEDCDCEGGWEE